MSPRGTRTARRAAVAGLLAAAAWVLLAGPASAHPTDEVVQQIYLTPAASGLTVRLDLTPGVRSTSTTTGRCPRPSATPTSPQSGAR